MDTFPAYYLCHYSVWFRIKLLIDEIFELTKIYTLSFWIVLYWDETTYRACETKQNSTCHSAFMFHYVNLLQEMWCYWYLFSLAWQTCILLQKRSTIRSWKILVSLLRYWPWKVFVSDTCCPFQFVHVSVEYIVCLCRVAVNFANSCHWLLHIEPLWETALRTLGQSCCNAAWNIRPTPSHQIKSTCTIVVDVLIILSCWTSAGVLSVLLFLFC